MAYGHVSVERFRFSLAEYCGNQPHAPAAVKLSVTAAYNPGGFLTAVLQGVQTKHGKLRGILNAVKPHNAAVVAGVATHMPRGQHGRTPSTTPA
jgi:hypothetical protein